MHSTVALFTLASIVFGKPSDPRFIVHTIEEMIPVTYPTTISGVTYTNIDLVSTTIITTMPFTPTVSLDNSDPSPSPTPISIETRAQPTPKSIDNEPVHSSPAKTVVSIVTATLEKSVSKVETVTAVAVVTSVKIETPARVPVPTVTVSVEEPRAESKPLASIPITSSYPVLPTKIVETQSITETIASKTSSQESQMPGASATSTAQQFPNDQYNGTLAVPKESNPPCGEACQEKPHPTVANEQPKTNRDEAPKDENPDEAILPNSDLALYRASFILWILATI